MNNADVSILAALCAGSFVLSWAAVYYLTAYLQRRQVVDIPNVRSSHQTPTPRGGGLVIVAITLLGWLPYGFVRSSERWPTLLACAGGALLIATVSWLDDVRSLSNRVRFAAHSAAAVLVILGVGFWTTISLPALGPIRLDWFGTLFTFFWIAGLTNAYNFMDGIDGIAAGQAAVAGFMWTVLGWLGTDHLTCSLGVLIAGSSLGFLAHNWSPARIFLGDVGSAYLGYLFAAMPLVFTSSLTIGAGDSRSLMNAVLILWPFLFDTAFTLVRRLRKGENIFAAHRSHLYQRLIAMGHSHRFVAGLYISLALAGGLLSLVWYEGTDAAEMSVVVALPVLCLSLWGFVVWQEYQSREPVVQRDSKAPLPQGERLG